MKKVFCSVDERFVNPLFEVFDGGDLILSSYRDIERPQAEMSVYVADAADEPRARAALGAALEIVGVEAELSDCDIADDDWKFAYRRHFKTEHVSPRVLVQPDWEKLAVIRLDPGMAFGTGKHETTKACLQYIDECVTGGESFLDMGCGSGILSIAAAKLGCSPVRGFDVDPEAVNASVENAAKNGVAAEYSAFALGRRPAARLPGAPAAGYDLVAANILGPLLVRFADEIVGYVGGRLIVSGILTEFYAEVLAAYEARGFAEVSRKSIGEWTTGLLRRNCQQGRFVV